MARFLAIRLLRNLRGSLKNPHSIDNQVLSRADFSAQPTNLTQDTRIAERAVDSANRLQIKRKTESKSRNLIIPSFFAFAKQKQKIHESRMLFLDSSLHATHFAKNDEMYFNFHLIRFSESQ